MAYLCAFGAYLPQHVVTSEELAAGFGVDAAWIRSTSGIEARRYASQEETVVAMGVEAAQRCLRSAGVAAQELSTLIVSSGTADRQFPGPASAVAHHLGLDSTPALDLPVASAGAIFGLSLASRLCSNGPVLVVASERMSEIANREPKDRAIAPLFGDGAGACLVAAEPLGTAAPARIIDSALHSDGAFALDLRLEFGQPLRMNGRSVILQASRKIPRVIRSLLERHEIDMATVGTFLMHQANQNLIRQVAADLGVAADRFYSNIARYGNTSSASLLIAAAEWQAGQGFARDVPVIFAGFGAGFHWGALLARGA